MTDGPRPREFPERIQMESGDLEVCRTGPFRALSLRKPMILKFALADIRKHCSEVGN